MILDPVPEHMDAVLGALENNAEFIYPILEKGFVLMRSDSQKKTKKDD
jgi:hypothetical protein